MTRTLRPLSLSQVLDETFDIYRHHLLLFIGISAIPNLALLAFELISSMGRGTKTTDALSLVAALGTMVVSWFCGSIVTAATTFAVSDIYLDRPASLAASFSRVTGKALRVGFSSLLVSLIVGIGFALCIAPGVYWAGLYGVAVPAVVLEDISAGQSLSRSSFLTQGSVFRVIVVYFLTSIFTMVMVWAVTAGLLFLGPTLFQHTGILTQQAATQILASLAATVFGPVTAIGLTLMYYDLRVRKEAFDIDHMMRMMAPENLASGASAS